MDGPSGIVCPTTPRSRVVLDIKARAEEPRRAFCDAFNIPLVNFLGRAGILPEVRTGVGADPSTGSEGCSTRFRGHRPRN